MFQNVCQLPAKSSQLLIKSEDFQIFLAPQIKPIGLQIGQASNWTLIIEKL